MTPFVCQFCGALLKDENDTCQRRPCIVALKHLKEVKEPSHYTQQVPGIECKDVTSHFNFNRGNIIKYAWRCGEKGDPVQDLQKIIQYAQFEIDRLSQPAPTKIPVEKEEETQAKANPSRIQEICENFLKSTGVPSFIVFSYAVEPGRYATNYMANDFPVKEMIRAMTWAVNDLISKSLPQ